MQSRYGYCDHHHLGFTGEEEVGSILSLLEPAGYSDKPPEKRGELWTIRFPAHAEISWASRKLCQGNMQLRVLPVIISTLKRLPWTPFLLGCTWGQPTAYGLLLFAKHRWLLTAAQRVPRTLALPFLCTFPCNPGLSGSQCRSTALTSRAQLWDFTEYLAKHAASDIVQNNSEDVHATLMACRKNLRSLKSFHGTR